jgi:hypothetical protein
MEGSETPHRVPIKSCDDDVASIVTMSKNKNYKAAFVSMNE